jgi:hypothetical protein
MENMLRTLTIDAPVFEPTKRCLVHRHRNVSGLCPVLAALFYPTFRHGGHSGRWPFKRTYPSVRVTPTRGIRVHAQLEGWRATGRLPRDQLARNIVESLTSRGITLTACEVPVVYSAANVGTLIDALGVDATGRTVVLEFKTGYQRTGLAQGHLAVLETVRIPSRPLNHALLQLAMTRAILHAEYGLSADQHLLIISNGRGVEIHTLPEWTMEVKASQLLLRFR